MRSNVVRCPRGRHPLAWLEGEGEDDGAALVARAVSPGREQRAISEVRIPVDELRGTYDEAGEPYGRFVVTTGCSCGSRFDVDLVAVLKGRPQRLRRDTTDYRDFGVSFDR